MATANIYDLADTWNDGGTTFTAIKMDVTNTNSAAGSLLFDLQVGSSSRFAITKDGDVSLGEDVAAPDTRTISAQSVIAGTSNTAGQNFTIQGSAGTGSGAGGSIIFQVAPAGGSGTGQNTLVDALTIASDKSTTFSGAVNIGNNTIFGSGGYYLALRGGGITLLADVRAVTGFSFGTSATTQLRQDASDTLALRNGTNAQTFNIYNTYTNATNYERFSIIAQSGDSVLIGTNKGSGGGTARALELQTDGQTRLTVAAAGGIITEASGFYAWSGRASVYSDAANKIRLYGWGTDFDMLQFSGTTSSYPALKRSTTSLQARLADDTGFTEIQGKLTTDTAYTAGAPTPAGYLVVYDSTGTAYKIPAEAV